MVQESLKREIENELKKIEKMLKNEETKDIINLERKKLDRMLEEYVKHI